MPQQEEITGFRLIFLALSIALAAFLVSLEGFIVNVAIPTISGELGVRNEVGVWLITVFSMTSTLFILLSGWLSNRFGKPSLFIFGCLLFTFTSWLCGFVHNFSFLLIVRIFQGASAGLLTPVTLTLIIETFPEKKRSIAVGFWSFFVMVGPAMGPMIGGWFSDYYWPWLFYINIPIGLFCAGIGFILLRNRHETIRHSRFDWPGILFLYISLGSLQVALNRGYVDDWFRSLFILILFIIFVIGITFFITWEIFTQNPFVDLSNFKKRNFSLASFSVGIGMSMLFSSFVLDSLWVQEILGYTPAWAGYTLTPVGLFPLIFYPLIGKFVSKLDIRIWIGMSFLLYAFTFFWMSGLNAEATFLDLAMPRLVQGIGFALLTVPNSLVAIKDVKKENIIFVVSLFSFVRMLFVGLGIPLATNLWYRRETFYQSRIVEQTYPQNPVFKNFLSNFHFLEGFKRQAVAAQATIEIQASTLGLMDIYYLFGWLFVVLFFVVFFYKIPGKIKTSHGHNLLKTPP